jgi:UDP-hydrolysing UDP-N-acetyl-D-glucosamine 2-epimerase
MAKRPRRIAVVSTGRADYGPLFWVLKGLADRPECRLQLILMGGHFARGQGSTHRAVAADGFVPAAEIRTPPRGDSDAAIAASIGRSTVALGEALDRLRPDIIVILGDRYELLAVGAAATAFRIPLVHLHGGEATGALIDDAVRNSITKLSHLHLVAAKPYAERVARLGEQKWRIRVVGAPSLDHLAKTALPRAEPILARLGVSSDDRPLLMVTLHPVTLRRGETVKEAKALAAALRGLPVRAIVTAPNTDNEHRAVLSVLRGASSSTATIRSAASLGTAAYWALMRAADVVVGNSSSGLLEAPSLGVPTVNIGDRQKGRLRGRSVIDVRADPSAIRRGIRRALSPAFKARARTGVNPYGGPGASARIVEIILSEPLDRRLLEKPPA